MAQMKRPSVATVASRGGSKRPAGPNRSFGSSSIPFRDSLEEIADGSADFMNQRFREYRGFSL